MQDLSMSNILNREISKEKQKKKPSKKEKDLVIPTDLTQINCFTYFSQKINLTTFKIPQIRTLVKRLKKKELRQKFASTIFGLMLLTMKFKEI